MHPSVVFRWVCLGILAGVALASRFPLVTVAVGGAAVVVSCLWHPRLRRIAVYAALGCVCGVLRVAAAMPSFPPNHIVHRHGAPLTFSGEVVTEPDVRLADQRLTVSARPPFAGRALVVAPRRPTYAYGDRLEITCTLHAPEPVEEFRYDRYLARFGIYSRCTRPTIVWQSRGGTVFLRTLADLKTASVTHLNRTIPEPQSSFAAGLLLGARRSIPADVLADFTTTGTSHIVALSGYNVTIIAVAMLRFGLIVGLRRQHAAGIAAALIVLFVLLTGAGSSIVRAGIMGLLALLAQQLGRRSRVGTALLASATAMVFVTPPILLEDVGFQLSFLSTIGLVYFATPFGRAVRWMPSAGGLRESLSTTFAAIIITTPLILYQFERLSLIAPVANILVLPVIPWAMAAVFLMGIVTAAAPFLAGALVWVAYLPLAYVLQIIGWLARVPQAAVTLPSVPVPALLGWYGLYVVFLVRMNGRRLSRRRMTRPEQDGARRSPATVYAGR